MTPDDARNRLKEFLYQETDVPKKIFDGIVRKRMERMAVLSGRQDEPAEKEIADFVNGSFAALEADTEKAVNRLCSDLLPAGRFWFLVKEFGVLSIFLIPPLAFLLTHMISLWNACPRDIEAVAGCLVGAVLLACLITASAWAMLERALDRRKNRKS